MGYSLAPAGSSQMPPGRGRATTFLGVVYWSLPSTRLGLTSLSPLGWSQCWKSSIPLIRVTAASQVSQRCLPCQNCRSLKGKGVTEDLVPRHRYARSNPWSEHQADPGKGGNRAYRGTPGGFFSRGWPAGAEGPAGARGGRAFVTPTRSVY